MSVRVRKLTLWRTEVEHRPGALAGLLAPLSAAGVDLQVLMGYRLPGVSGRAVVELAPVTSRKATLAAGSARLSPAVPAALLVIGDNRPGLAGRIAQALADSNVNVAFLVAQVVGRRYSAVFGFETEAELDRAADRIRIAAAARPLSPRRRRPVRTRPPARARGARRAARPARR